MVAGSYVQQLVLESVPAARADAVTATVLALRADLNPEHMNAQLRRLEAAGRIHATSDNSGRRYFRTEEPMPEETTTTKKASMRERVAGQLPVGRDNAETAATIASHLGTAPANINAVLGHLVRDGAADRRGPGGPQKPFRYFLASSAGDLAETAETEAADRGLTAEREATDTRGSTTEPPWRCPDCNGRLPHPGGGCPNPAALAAVADTFDPPAPEEAAAIPGGPFLARHPATRAAAFDVVAKDLEARAIEARRDAEIFTAAAKLLVRIRDEDAVPA